MIFNERTSRHEQVVAVARQMLTAARTAPKARGVDIVEVALIEGDEMKLVADKMVEIGEQRNRPSFIRDAGNVLQAECIVVIGTKFQSISLNCAHCGFATCAEKPAEVPCAINSIDVGIAIGSACATAADLRLDTRVMYSIGVAVEQLGFLGADVNLTMGIAVSASSKNPFFDRPTK